MLLCKSNIFFPKSGNHWQLNQLAESEREIHAFRKSRREDGIATAEQRLTSITSGGTGNGLSAPTKAATTSSCGTTTISDASSAEQKVSQRRVRTNDRPSCAGVGCAAPPRTAKRCTCTTGEIDSKDLPPSVAFWKALPNMAVLRFD